MPGRSPGLPGIGEALSPAGLPAYRAWTLSPNVTAELNQKGELIGIEIINASAFLRDALLEGVQAKVLNLVNAGES
jgi:uncharacterized protein YuzE